MRSPEELVLAMQVGAMSAAVHVVRHGNIAAEQEWPADHVCAVCQTDAAKMVAFLRRLNWGLVPNPSPANTGTFDPATATTD